MIAAKAIMGAALDRGERRPDAAAFSWGGIREPAMTVRMIFFDIGDTLGQVAMSPDGRALRLSLCPYVLPILTTLRDRGLRLGVISNTGDRPQSEIDALLEEEGIASNSNHHDVCV